MTTGIKISVAAAPGPQVEELAVPAEELGFERYWL